MISILCIPLSLVVMTQVEKTQVFQPPDLRCGSYCLFVALRATGLAPGSFAAVEGSLGTPSDRGYSMAQLCQEARTFGANATCVKTSLDHLQARGGPFVCICLLNKNHFVILKDLDRDKGTARIIDPPDSYDLPLDTFRGMWSGEALLLGPVPLVPEEAVRESRLPRVMLWVASALAVSLAGWTLSRTWRRAGRRAVTLNAITLFAAFGPFEGCGTRLADHRDSSEAQKNGLVIEPTHHDLGTIPLRNADHSRVVLTSIRNSGIAPVAFKEIRQSCGYTAVSLDTDLLSPGGRATLTARISLGVDPGVRQSHLTLVTSDPERPLETVSFQWQVVSPLRTEPAAYDFGRLRPGERKSAAVEVMSEDLPVCDRSSVQLNPSSSMINCGFLRKVWSDESPNVRTVHHAPFVLGELRISILGDDEVRMHKEEVGISLRCGDFEVARYQVPITWRLSPLIDTSPGRLWLGSRQPGEEVPCHLRLASLDQTEFRIRSIRCESPDTISGLDFEASPGVVHSVDFVTKLPRDRGPWRTRLIVATDRDGAGEIVVPLSSVVQASQANE